MDTSLVPPPWPSLSSAESPRPIASVRAASVEALRRRPWPNPKDEAWRYSPLRALNEALQRPPLASRAQPPSPQLAAPWCSPEAWSERALPSGVTLCPFEQAASAFPELLGRLGEALPPGTSPMADANTIGYDRGWLLHVEEGVTVAEPLWLGLPWTGAPLERPRLLLVLRRGASLRLGLAHPPASGEAVRIEVIEALLEKGAHLEQLSVLRPGPGRLLAHLGARLGEGAAHRLLVLGLGGQHNRIDVHQRLDGPGAEALAGAVLHAAERETVEFHVHAEHAAPRSTSEQLVRAAATDRGRAVGDARARVLPGAGDCEVGQRLDGLLLARGARVVCRPELTIEVDEVMARHGATVGALDEAARFYLRSRGLDARDAEQLLRAAFLAAPLTSLEAAPLQAEAVSTLERFLGRSLPTGAIEDEPTEARR